MRNLSLSMPMPGRREAAVEGQHDAASIWVDAGICRPLAEQAHAHSGEHQGAGETSAEAPMALFRA